MIEGILLMDSSLFMLLGFFFKVVSEHELGDTYCILSEYMHVHFFCKEPCWALYGPT